MLQNGGHLTRAFLHVIVITGAVIIFSLGLCLTWLRSWACQKSVLVDLRGAQ